MEKEIYEKIIAKKEFSQLLKKDVEIAWKKFERRQTSDEEKIRLTRDLLRKVFSVFASGKLLSVKNKDAEWILKKHISTRERLPYYKELYKRLLDKDYAIFDLGAGVNGFSYNYFPKGTEYVAVEAVGQLVNLMNNYFQDNKLKAKAIHESLFELEKIKKLIKQVVGIQGRTPKDFKKKSLQGAKIIFLFKTLDSLEMIERDYSKKLLKEIVPLAERVVVSFATRSLVSRKKFNVKRSWIKNFIKENFNVLDEFELGGEEYVVFENK